MNILVIAESDGAQIKPATLHAVAAARKIGSGICLLIAGYEMSEAAAAGAAIHGVDKVIVADAPHLATATAENLTEVVMAASALGRYTHVVATATVFAKNFLPRVAARLDVAQASDVIEVCGPDTFVRPIYAGAAMATVKLEGSVKVISVRATAFYPVAAIGGHAAIEHLADVPNRMRSKVIRRDIARLERPELASARVIIAGGRGMAGRENFKLLEAVADKLGAAIGASRGAVDAGYAPSDYQVGQTGKVVAPDLYIAVGISGAIQHLAGMQGSRVIVAVNKDAEAPIFEVASYGIVGDLFEAMPALSEALA